MSVNLKGKIYRNQNEQIVENANDITKLDERITDLEESVEASVEEINGKIEEINENMPTVNNSEITITQGGVTKGSFKLNQNSNATIELDEGGSGIELYMAHISLSPSQVGVSEPSCLFTFDIPITSDYASTSGLITSSTLNQILTDSCNAFGFDDPNYDLKVLSKTANGVYSIDNGDSTYTNCLVVQIAIGTRKSTGEFLPTSTNFGLRKYENLNKTTAVYFSDVENIPYLDIQFTPYKYI